MLDDDYEEPIDPRVAVLSESEALKRLLNEVVVAVKESDPDSIIGLAECVIDILEEAKLT